MRLGARVAEIYTASRHAHLADGDHHDYDALLLATGAEPIHLDIPGAALRGGAVGEYLETRTPGIVAAGDIARWPGRLSDEHIRLERWVFAERQGQGAAHNMPRRRERSGDVPFFWTEQYDFSLAYVGHSERWEEAEIRGSLEARSCTVTYRPGGRELANAFVYRDHDSLRADLECEQTIAAGEVDSQGAPSYSTERR